MSFRNAIMLFLTAGILLNASAQNYMYRLLVAYTQEFADSNANPLAVIDQHVAYINDVIHPNSNLGDIQVELVCAWNSGYNQSASVFTDVDRMRNHGDGYMDSITSVSTDSTHKHGLRNRYRADVCFLALENESDWSGAADGINRPESRAFTVGCLKPSFNYLTMMPHEIGHLMGALHQNSGSNTPYAFAHGYQYTTTDSIGRFFKTVMCHELRVERFRFSSPNIIDLGETIGDSAWRDNVRLVRGRMDGTLNVGNPGRFGFYRTTHDTLILTNEVVGEYEARTAIATESITLGNGYGVSRNGRFTARITSNPMGKKAAQPEPAGIVAGAERFSLKAVVESGNIKLEYMVQKEGIVTAHIFDLAGRHVKSVNLGAKKSGLHTAMVPGTGIGSGKYFVLLQSGNLSSSKDLIIVK